METAILQTKTCGFCKETFQTDNSRKKYCSTVCARKKYYANRLKNYPHDVVRECRWCNKTFKVGKKGNTRRIFLCSKTCSQKKQKAAFAKWRKSVQCVA